MTDERYSISQVARCFDVPVSTLRYYDELGLLPAAERRGNVRYYGHAELRRLALIQCLHHRGLVSLADTATLIAESPATNQPSGREVLTTSIEAIRRRIDDLQAAQQLLEHLLTCPRTDPVRECAPLRTELGQAVDHALAALDAPPGHQRPGPRQGGHRRPPASMRRNRNVHHDLEPPPESSMPEFKITP
ncbi:MerR family transcriptional regulator [Nonomuraea sp. NPDC050153]|uniref:MerR family transcriptional regulator n=1 Tax=Nonomuraea sp. NPDC050153 TaxID=3364359 RepID=UPI0037964E35